MTVVPLPDTPSVRIRTLWSEGGSLKAGNRFFLSYSGSAPSGANCATLASDVAGAWGTHLSPVINANWELVEVDVIDIATHSGASGTWSGAVPATRAGAPLQQQCCTNVEFDIARRYRGGKPRIYMPGASVPDLQTDATYNTAFLSAMNSAFAAFIAELAGLSIGSMGTLAHINLSYYSGFTNHTSTSGRARAVPTYRATALSDPVVGYATKAVLGTQRRRLTSLS